MTFAPIPQSDNYMFDAGPARTGIRFPDVDGAEKVLHRLKLPALSVCNGLISVAQASNGVRMGFLGASKITAESH